MNQLFTDYERRDQRTRQVAYASAMAELTAQELTDTEALLFYALSLSETRGLPKTFQR
ncbi:MAG: hypothetical protein ABI969_17150 [bacterium]